MYRIMRVLFVIPAVVLLGLIISGGRVQAQQSPQPVYAVKGCDPCIINRYMSLADSEKEARLRLKYCEAHPGECTVGDRGWSRAGIEAMEKAQDAQARQDPNYYKKQEPGHTTMCFSDVNPKNPTHNVCIPDTWWTQWPTEPQPGHCYSNPDNRTEVRCVPTREQLMKAD